MRCWVTIHTYLQYICRLSSSSTATFPVRISEEVPRGGENLKTMYRDIVGRIGTRRKGWTLAIQLWVLSKSNLSCQLPRYIACRVTSKHRGRGFREWRHMALGLKLLTHLHTCLRFTGFTAIVVIMCGFRPVSEIREGFPVFNYQ